MQLTKHFWLKEFTRSDTATLLGIPNEPTGEHLANIRDQLAPFLEKVRALPEVGGRPIFIESGYRCPAVNLHPAVRGSLTSAHSVGLTADLQVAGMTDLQLAKAIRDSDLQFDQLILEGGRTVHIGVGPGKRRLVQRQPGPAGTPLYNGLE